MAFISHLRTQLQSWWQNTPLPTDVAATFQSWHEFDKAGHRWRAVEPKREINVPIHNGQREADWECQSYNFVTWNVDYSSPFPGDRLSSLLSQIFSLSPAVDIIFFQELSAKAFLGLLDEPEIRRGWFLSDANGVLPAGQSFTTITLLSKRRFQTPNPGPAWRVKYPSRFQRDALCCDIFVPLAPGTPGHPARVRLVNVHLDSLPIQPSLRSQQVSSIAALIRSAGRGIVAGDFNPVLPTDDTLVPDNGLVDAWAELHPDDPGFTWGLDRKEPFPPNRMDKVAMVGLSVENIEVLSPGYISRTAAAGGVLASGSTQKLGALGNEKERGNEEMVSCSDHLGLRCSFNLGNV